MASSSSFYGLRRGSTKSLTFSVCDGKQITKDRVEKPKNPRSHAQMSQRCMVATIGTAYAAMKSICNHSFEEKTTGMECMRMFFSENLKKLRLCKEYNNGLFGFIKYQQSGLVPGSYIISAGSLPDSCPNAAVSSITVASKQVSINVTAGNSIADITHEMGCKRFDDTCTIALMYQKADGSYGFGAVRFTYKQGNTVQDSFIVDVFGDVLSATPSYGATGVTLSIIMNQALASTAAVSNTYLAAIASRKMNDNWQRSNAKFNVQNAYPTFSEAIATYPVGAEYILNGGGTATFVVGEQSSSSGSGTTNPSNPTNGNGETPSGGGTTGGDNGGDDSGIGQN